MRVSLFPSALLLLAVFGPASGTSLAQSTVEAGNESLYGANIGWINARATPQAASGLRVDEYVCSGYIYSANVGWIHFGDGTPANGIAYQNASAMDYGVNCLPDGKFQGYAYGANIGWIKFDPAITDAPRYDQASGKLRGYAYGANIGWINLGETSAEVDATLDYVAAGRDSDADGIADAWELLRTGGVLPDPLSALNGEGADLDGDGATDVAEYQGDTDPLDPDDTLKIISYVPSPGYTSVDLIFTSKTTRRYEVKTSTSLTAPFTDIGLGKFQGQLNQTMVGTLVNPGTEPSRFWRVEASRPLMGP